MTTASPTRPAVSSNSARRSVATTRRSLSRAAVASANGRSANSPTAGPRHSASASSSEPQGLFAAGPGRFGQHVLEPGGVELAPLNGEAVATLHSGQVASCRAEGAAQP